METTTKLGDKWRAYNGGLYKVIEIKPSHFDKFDEIRIQNISICKSYGFLAFNTSQRILNRDFEKQAI